MGQEPTPAAPVTTSAAARAGRLVPLAAVGLAFALGAAGLTTQSLWRDEVDAIRFAGQPLPELLRMFLTPGQNGPLYFVLLRPWLAAAGDGEFALRFFSLFFGVLAVALTYRLARRLLPGGRWTARAAALLAATSPYWMWYSQEGKMYTLVVALALAAMTCYLAALRHGGRAAWLGYVAATTASFYAHLLAVLLVPAQIAIFVLGPWERRARLRAWLLCLAVLIVPYVPLLLWQLPALANRVDTGYAFYPPGEMLLALLADYGQGVVPAAGVWAAILFGVVALAALLWLPGPRAARRAAVRLAAAWLFVPVLLLFLVTLRRPMFTTRYLIFVLPAYLLLVAAGLAAVGRRSRVAAGVLLAVLLVLNGRNLVSQARTPIKADYRAATTHVLQRLHAEDLVLFQIPYGRYSFDYYLEQQAGRAGSGWPRPSTAAEGSYRWAEGLYTNQGMSPEEAGRRMAELTAGSRVVWLVESEAAMWDERGLVHAWLDAHGRLDGELRLTRVSVYRYVLAGSR